MAKRRHSQRKCIDDELGLEFALEELRGSEAPRNKDVLLHLFFFLRRDGTAQQSSASASKEVVQSIKGRWVGSGVEVVSDPTLVRRVGIIHESNR